MQNVNQMQENIDLDFDQMRTVFDDNGFPTLDDSDYGALFLAEYSETMESDGESYMPNFSELCDEIGLEFNRINDDIVAIFDNN